MTFAIALTPEQIQGTAAIAVAAIGAIAAILRGFRQVRTELRGGNANMHRIMGNMVDLQDEVILIRKDMRHTTSRVDELHDWMKGYSNGPLDSGEKVYNFVEGIGSRLARMEDRQRDMFERGCAQRQSCNEELARRMNENDRVRQDKASSGGDATA